MNFAKLCMFDEVKGLRSELKSKKKTTTTCC